MNIQRLRELCQAVDNGSARAADLLELAKLGREACAHIQVLRIDCRYANGSLLNAVAALERNNADVDQDQLDESSIRAKQALEYAAPYPQRNYQ